MTRGVDAMLRDAALAQEMRCANQEYHARAIEPAAHIGGMFERVIAEAAP